MSETKSVWNVVLVEDQQRYRNDVRKYFRDFEYDSRKLRISCYESLNDALQLISERKADLVILDVFQGDPRKGGVSLGEDILKSIVECGFAGIVFYTAFPEKVDSCVSRFVRLVNKTDGLEKLESEIKYLFDQKIPQTTRYISDQIDRSIASYMWTFAMQHWDELVFYSGKPQFMRIITGRLASEFAPPDKVQPAEFYVSPPICKNPELGDIRKRGEGKDAEYLLLVWPSCDLVEDNAGNPPRTAKTKGVLVLRALRLEHTPEYKNWQSDKKSGAKRLKKLVQNNRGTWKEEDVGSPERYHFLPASVGIPSLVIDFQVIEYIALDELKEIPCVGTLSSPFAESLSFRFLSYIGRLGTPDLDVDSFFESLK